MTDKLEGNMEGLNGVVGDRGAQISQDIFVNPPLKFKEFQLPDLKVGMQIKLCEGLICEIIGIKPSPLYDSMANIVVEWIHEFTAVNGFEEHPADTFKILVNKEGDPIYNVGQNSHESQRKICNDYNK